MKNKFKHNLLLGRFRAAFSPLYESYVKIIKVRQDDKGDLLIDALVLTDSKVVIFRETELIDYE